MNEYLIFSEMDLKNICCICLRVVDSMWIMSENEMILYRSIVRKNTNQTLQTCLLCKWMLGKFSKFAQQCQKADELLCQTLIDSTPLEPVSLSYNFITTHQTCSISENDDESCSNFDDIDEVPLVEFKKEVIEKWNGKSKRKKRKNEEESPIKEELKEEKYIKPKKELKSGFTSRMVQETDEYEVIKLTKDQVLQEMNEKSKEISYTQTPYKCDKCVKGFNFEDVLRKHNEKHCMENGSFQCDICFQYCPSAVSLRGHMKSHTTRYKCKVCGTIRLSRQHLLEHHAITHTGQPTSYNCETCSYTTNKRTVIQRHVRSHATSQQHACHECGKLFKSIDSLRIHTTRHNKSGCYQCETCDKAFTYPCLLRKHLNTAHDGDTHYCVECDVKFKSFESLRLHFKRAKRHRDESSYTFKCRHCPETFATGSALSAHLTSIHGEPKQHSCAVCSKWFSSKEALRSHHWKVHDSKRNREIKCDVCQRSFNRKSVLKLHARTHTGERPHSCECGAAFSQRTTLRTHRNAKHKIENGIINAMTIPTVLHETT